MSRGSKNRTSDFYPHRMLMVIQKLMTATAPLNVLTKAASNVTLNGDNADMAGEQQPQQQHETQRGPQQPQRLQPRQCVPLTRYTFSSGYALQCATLCLSYRPSWRGPSSEGNIHLKANSDVTWTLRRMISVLVTLYVCNLPRSHKKKKWYR